MMYDPYTMDRMHYEQSQRQRRIGNPSPTRVRAAASRRLAQAEARWRRPEPCTD